MKNRNIGLGVFLLTVGVLWVLMNTGVIGWSVIDTLFTFWPLILVVIGISIIFRGKPGIKAAVWLLFVCFIVGYGYFFPERNKAEKAQQANAGDVTIQKAPETEKGKFTASMGGVKFSLDSETDKLLTASISDPFINYTEKYSDDKKNAEITFSEKRSVRWEHNGVTYDSSFHLNRDVVWDLKTQLGAISGSMDMSRLKVKSLDMDLGAGNLELIFGSAYEKTEVDIDAGASKLDIVVPGDAGVRIKADGVLSKTSLENLNWEKRDNYYTSPNYDEAKSRIDMKIDMGVGALSVKVGGDGPAV